MEDENTIEASLHLFNEDLHRKKVSVLPFDPQRYNRDGICLAFSQVNEVTIPLRAVSQKYEH